MNSDCFFSVFFFFGFFFSSSFFGASGLSMIFVPFFGAGQSSDAHAVAHPATGKHAALAST
jgi:hypothetical protein